MRNMDIWRCLTLCWPVLSLTGCLIGCQSEPAGVAPIINTKSVLPSQAALVSVQPTGPATAEVVIKLTSAIVASDWRLTAQTASGAAVSLQPGATEPLDVFALRSFSMNGLVAGQRYTLRLGFRYNKKDTLTVERTYTHATSNPWKRLAHLPFDDGLFTGSVISHEYDSARSGERIRVTRYANADQWQTMQFLRSRNRWFPDSPPGITVRRGLLEYILYFHNADRHHFYGLGYQTDELFPGKYVYLRDMFAILPGAGSIVFPFYGGEDGEVAYFTTTEWAFFLTNNGSPAMRGIYAQFEQESRAPLPEKPGVLATFSLGETGYVVNQVPGVQPHVFAYDSQKDVWTRKADFPGPQRTRGAGFSVSGKGYFGLGTAPDQRGLRDIYQYDPASDNWTYVTDYPGQGNRYLVVWSGPNRAYLGWGYESQPVVGAPGYRQVGCTDFWEFMP